MRKNTLQVAILNAILLMGGAMAYPATAYAQGQAQTYSIAGGDLETVLSRFGTESRIQLIYPPELLKGKRSNGLTGSHTSAEALRLLLEGSGLVAERVNDKTVVIKKAAAPAVKPQGATRENPRATQVKEAEVEELEAVTVTGTRIRGGTTPSPVIAIGSAQIAEEGFTNMGEVIRSIPQNFSGGQNPGVTAGATAGGNGNRNITGGSSLNLRGLGPDATLTLLNGRRMSYGGFTQMVDIDAIPIEAVDRLEVVADGASAIYGSDAVGGVANVILKPDFDGVTVGARYGTATEGGMDAHEYTATGGTTWSSGGLIATWKKSDNDPIYANQRRYTEGMYDPSTLYQEGEQRSGLISMHQSMGDPVEFHLDAFKTERDMSTDLAYATNYEHYSSETSTSLVSPSVDFFIAGGWKISIGGAWGKESSDVDNAVVSLATGTPTLSRTSYRNRSRMYEVGAEGPLFRSAAGEARLAVGAGYRYNSYLSGNLISGTVATDGDESSRFAYAELDFPLVGPDQNIFGMRRLALTGAVRKEDYDSFGQVTTPKFGLIYGPNADFTVKASWGKSFKAPNLSQQYLSQYAYLFPAVALGGAGYAADATVLYLAGGNPDLNPERARTWSVSLAFHPEAVPGLEAELSWFDVDYTDRVSQPLVPAQALSNPAFAEFVDYSPAATELADILAAYTLINATGAAYDARNVVAIAPNLYINMSRQQAKGLDMSGSYRLELGPGRLTVRGSASWLDSRQQVSSTQPIYDLSGTLFYPAKISGRMGAIWSQDGFTASVFGNYKSGVTNTADDRKGASFTDFDVSLRYDMGERGDAWSGLTFEFLAQNAFNRSPPLYASGSLTYTPFDSTNYSAIGRYLSFAVSKHW